MDKDRVCRAFKNGKGDIIMFCPKCGSLLRPKKEKNKKVLVCTSCNYSDEDLEKIKFREEINKKTDVRVVENEDSEQVYPKTEAECPKCGNKEAYYWTVQTRAGDEPETKFLKCQKCKHVWRDYS